MQKMKPRKQNVKIEMTENVTELRRTFLQLQFTGWSQQFRLRPWIFCVTKQKVEFKILISSVY